MKYILLLTLALLTSCSEPLIDSSKINLELNTTNNDLLIANNTDTQITYTMTTNRNGLWITWTITIAQTNHIQGANEVMEKEHSRWSNYFLWMNYTN